MEESDSKTRDETQACTRREQLMRAAFDVVAEEGFEGLRTRTVAIRAGVNIATLHYYFSGKENLIDALADYVSMQFISRHAPPVPPSGSRALDKLRQEFADTEFYVRECPDLLKVMREFANRSERDTTVARIFSTLTAHWKLSLLDTLLLARDEHLIDASTNLTAAADALIALLRGLATASPDTIQPVCEIILNWMTILKPAQTESLGEVKQ